MPHTAKSTASHGAFAQLVQSVTHKPCKELTDRLGERKRTKNGLARLLAAIERTPATKASST